MRIERFAANRSIFREGDYGNEAFRIIRGKVEIALESDGSGLVLAVLGEGEIFG
jgi:CRP-like cAMP-binding protein